MGQTSSRFFLGGNISKNMQNVMGRCPFLKTNLPSVFVNYRTKSFLLSLDRVKQLLEY